MSEPRADAVLSVSGLTKRYGRHEVLHGVDLMVSAHAVHGLVGLNGSGKTTTLECILGLQRSDSGNIQVLGLPPLRLHQSRGRVVGIFDTPSLQPNLSVRQNLELARLLCVNPVRSCSEVELLLDISRYSSFKVRHLSLGNRRRASIAQALLGKPELVVLDEPFNGLDADGVEQVLALITRLNREDGTAFLLSSHQLPYLERICSHLAILHRGRIAVSGTTDALFNRQSQRLQIHCDQPDLAVQTLAAAGIAGFIHDHATGLVEGPLPHGDAAGVNRCLVQAGVGVNELVRIRASLTSLFRDVTRSQESD